MTKLKLGVLISGSGSNLQAIIDGIGRGTLDVEIVTVVSNKPDAFGLKRAETAGIRAVAIEPKDFADTHEFNEAIARELQDSGAELVVMAGYMKLLGSEVLNAFPNKVLNLHPALLPLFPGAHGIQDAFDAGVKVTGVTVHFANEVFDEGPIIKQVPVQVEENDTVETLEARIHAVEHELLPEVIQSIAQGRVSVIGRKVEIDT